MNLNELQEEVVDVTTMEELSGGTDPFGRYLF